MAEQSAREILAHAYEREMKQRQRERLGDNLRRTYEPTVRAPLPSDWLKLIDSWRKRLKPHEE